jgi:hypothetical protein
VRQAVRPAVPEVGQRCCVCQQRARPRIRDGELDFVVLDQRSPTVPGALVDHHAIGQPMAVVLHHEHLEPDVRLLVPGQPIDPPEGDGPRLTLPANLFGSDPCS